MTHNGESVAKELIDVSEFDLPKDVDATDALYYFAASVVIMALQGRNPGFEGLAGATRWKGLGLQALATDNFKLGDPELEAMLEDAVYADSGNHLALFALENARHRRATERKELTAFADVLKDELAVIQGLPKRRGQVALDLELRVRLVLAIVSLNLMPLPATPHSGEAPSPEEAKKNIVELILLLNKERESAFHKGIRGQAAGALKESIPDPPDPEEKP